VETTNTHLTTCTITLGLAYMPIYRPIRPTQHIRTGRYVPCPLDFWSFGAEPQLAASISTFGINSRVRKKNCGFGSTYTCASAVCTRLLQPTLVRQASLRLVAAGRPAAQQNLGKSEIFSNGRPLTTSDLVHSTSTAK